MSETREQKIAVLIGFTPADKTLILNGIKTAVLFGKGLCLVYPYRKREKKAVPHFRKKLQQLLAPVKAEIPNLKTSTLLMHSRRSELARELADDFEVILIVAASGQFRRYAAALTQSPVPFLFVASDAPVSGFKKIIMPLDLRKENSDSALWSSWFGRFNEAEIVVVAANEKGKEEQQQIAKNVYLTKKLFTRVNIAHKVYKGRRSSLRNSFEALDAARSSGSDLLILLGSSTITPLDMLVGLPERKIVRHAGNLPVLLINPRKDNYVLCD